ncbi:MAG: hypothetical protein AAF581_07915 [Planctomycetota bacterium]
MRFVACVSIGVLLTVAGCSSSDQELLEQTALLADSVAHLAERESGSPVIHEVELEQGKMVILAFPNGDYQAWSISEEGVVKGLGYQSGPHAYRLIPGGHITSQ